MILVKTWDVDWLEWHISKLHYSCPRSGRAGAGAQRSRSSIAGSDSSVILPGKGLEVPVKCADGSCGKVSLTHVPYARGQLGNVQGLAVEAGGIGGPDCEERSRVLGFSISVNSRWWCKRKAHLPPWPARPKFAGDRAVHEELGKTGHGGPVRKIVDVEAKKGVAKRRLKRRLAR